MRLPHIAATPAGVATLLVLACSGSAQPEAAPAPAPKPQPRASYPYTEADVQFMTNMIGHHAQALLIAGWAPTHGASSSIRTLTERIINGQQDEIGTMQLWLRDRGKPVPEAGRMAMHHDSGHHAMQMPGMLSEAQLQQLDRARGPEFDRLFLTFMIQHHKGAVTMVQELFGSRGAAQDETVFKFANDVSVDQSTEIARMEKMLSQSRTPS
jgi:uncharacterized protein (DUF305 family)